ncbi:MAG: hypothetical protein HRT45_03135 [Bdellovibrionales bacterium]|nr:hypothetical protein [Bdellovibrionales bacterium]
MTSKHCLLITALAVFSFQALSAVEVDDSRVIEPSKSTYQLESRGLAFKDRRKVGVGLSTAGALGFLGANIEINFTPQDSFMGGFGMGDSYQSYALQYKHSIGGSWFVPYVGGGYARWYTVTDDNGRIQETSPGLLADKFLSRRELNTGRFDEHLFYPMAGVQYFQLKGKWAGFSLYAQVMMLLDLDDLVSAPTGEFGAFFYF